MKRTVILGVTGSIAAYRSADVARALMRAGFEVRTCLTRAAQEFVTPALFEGLTGQPCLTHAFDEPVRGRMAHIDWARDAAALLVCPATANAIAKFANGEGDDMLTTIALASDATLVICPAMNPHMYADETVQRNLKALRARGAVIIEPEEGDVACGENGQGKLASVERIVSITESVAKTSALYEGLHVVITSGPTYEPIDDVRFLGNRSSGKMGLALASAAVRMSARVSLVMGPTHGVPHPRVETTRVTTAQEMLDATAALCGEADLLIAAAAVADFRPQAKAAGKIRREGPITLTLEPTPDIVATVTERYPKLAAVGFAAEPGNDLESARRKLEEKGLIAIFLNDVSRPDIGFESDQNEGVLLLKTGQSVAFRKASKYEIAWRILDTVRPLIPPQ